GIAREERRRAHNLTATNADLFTQPRTIDFKPIEPETVHRETFAIRLDLSAAPKHGAPLSRMLAVADVADIAAVFDWRSALELGGPQLVFDVPGRTMIRRRATESAL